MVRVSQKRIWRRVWHSRSTPSDASKSERTWRALSARLCCKQEFDEMKRACAHCGMFEDEDDILVRCQGPDRSLRSADYEMFHGRCAAALGHSGGARWQNCPWCPPTTCGAKPGTAFGVDVSDHLDDEVGGGELRRLMIQRRWRWSRKRIVLRAASEERLQEKLREVRRRLVACLPVGASAKKKTESFREMQSTLKGVEKEWRMLFNDELANLELDLSGVPTLQQWAARES